MNNSYEAKTGNWNPPPPLANFSLCMQDFFYVVPKAVGGTAWVPRSTSRNIQITRVKVRNIIYNFF